MPLWKPPNDQIGHAEVIGRRLFDEPTLAGAGDQAPIKLDLRHFEDTRNDDFSVDRIGRGIIEQKVIEVLVPLARASQRKSFNGWVTLRADKFRGSKNKPSLSVYPDPIPGNAFHARIDTRGVAASDPHHHYLVALALQHIFSKGTIHHIQDKGQDYSVWMWFRFKVGSILAWLRINRS
jgi:hypothetical protein